VNRKNPDVTPRTSARWCVDMAETITSVPPAMGASASAAKKAKSFFSGEPPRVTNKIVFSPSVMS
jgi:hypothetical protein